MAGTAFVGRDAELGRLQAALDLSLTGRGQVILVSGLPGSGKTALCRTFLARVLSARADLLVATGSGNAQTGVSDPYLHQDVGTALEALYGARAQEVAAPLSRHFEEAGMPAKAAAYRLQAGDAAKRVSAFQDAEDHLMRGLQLIELLPQGAERIALEIGLRASLGAALVARRGYGAAEVVRNIERARLLCAQLGDPPQVLPVLFGLLTVKFVKSDLRYCLREGETLEGLAERSGEGGFRTGGRMVRGATMMYLGKHVEAQHFLETAIADYDAARYRDQVFLVGLDPLSTALSYLSWVQWFRGAIDQAVITGGRSWRRSPYSIPTQRGSQRASPPRFASGSISGMRASPTPPAGFALARSAASPFGRPWAGCSAAAPAASVASWTRG